MNATVERDWQDWGTAWRQGGTVSLPEAGIRLVVERQTRRLRFTLAMECLVTVLVGVGVLWIVLAERTTAALVWGAAAVLHAAVVWIFTLWNRRGTWRPLSQAVGDYLALALARCEREARAARFGFWLVVSESAAVMAWVLASPRATEPAGPDWWWIPPTGVTAAVVGWTVWFGRRANRQAAKLRELARQLDD